jgi:ammonia channel protein AmtB
MRHHAAGVTGQQDQKRELLACQLHLVASERRHVGGDVDAQRTELDAQVFEVVVGFAWAFGITYLIFSIAKRFMKIRVSREVELAGLDMAEFGGVCYPDFVLASNTPGHAAAYAGVHTLGDEEAPTITREDGDRTETGSRA